MMQIIVKSEGYTYMYDTTVNDKLSEDGLEPDFITAEEAISTALRLLACSYGHEAIQKAIPKVIEMPDWRE